MDISPGVSISESTIININPSLNVAMYVGEFEKGNINEPVLITSILQFKMIFGRSMDFNYNHWYQIYNYLQYSSSPRIWVCRTAGSNCVKASNNSNFANSPGEWGNLLTVEIYSKLEYDGSSYLQEIFNFYSGTEIIEDYLVVIRRKETIVESFTMSVGSILSSQYIESINLEPGIYELTGGKTVSASSENYFESFEIFTKEDYEIDIVIAPEDYNDIVIDFVENRKDCVAFLSIPRKFVKFLMVNDSLLMTEDNELIIIGEYNLKNKIDDSDVNNIKDYLSSVYKSSYCFMALGYKTQLDNFSGKKRIININGDLAGLKSAGSAINPWGIGAGLERGRIKNALEFTKISKTSSDELYKLGVNSIENGVLMTQKLFVDETFNVNRMHARNIYNFLERKCEKLLRRYLFELNDLKLRGIIAQELKLLLEDIMDSRGIEAGKVIVSKNSENNIIINIYIKMINISEFINLRMNTAVNSINLTSEIQIKS